MSYDYPRAGHRAPPGVRAEIARFRRLPVSSSAWDKSQRSLLYFLLGSGQNPYLMSRPDAAYQDRPVVNQSCSNCSSAYKNLVKGDLTCSQVEGEIDLRSWCRLWNTDRF